MSLVFIAITLIAVFAGAGVAGAVLFPLLQRRVAELERLQGELIRLGQDLAIERERNESRAAAVSELEARLS